MPSPRNFLVPLLLAAAAALVAGPPPAAAEAELVVRKFLLGYLEEDTGRFVATGARGTDNAFRDNVILLVFSAPVDFGSVDHRTVRIGVPSGNGLLADAGGSFIRHEVRKFNPASGAWEVRKVYRNRILFDPVNRTAPVAERNPDGFPASTLHSVTVPGLDRGARETVRGRRGQRNLRTFTTTFRTTTEYVEDRY